MAILIKVPLGRYEDGTVNLSLNPATNISGWTIAFTISKRFGSDSPLYSAGVASGFNGVSGMRVTNGPLGQLTTPIPAHFASGNIEFGNYAMLYKRVDSGAMTDLALGFLTLVP